MGSKPGLGVRCCKTWCRFMAGPQSRQNAPAIRLGLCFGCVSVAS